MIRHPNLLLTAALALALPAMLIVWPLAGCTPYPSTSPPAPAAPPAPRATPPAPAQAHATPGPPLASLHGQPMIRVRLMHGVSHAIIDAVGPLVIGPASADTSADPRRFLAPVTLRRDAQGFIITDARGQSVRWALPALALSPMTRTARGMTIQGLGGGYPGTLTVTPTSSPGSSSAVRFDLVNHLGLERYLPGVLQQELFPKWDPVAYRAQAVAARSYALWELARDRGRAYDLVAGVGSQAYAGHASAKARAAVAATRGRVLTYGGRVVPAFYSSCCGGVAQDVAAVFPAKTPPIAPLRGHAPAAWCKPSPHYRWGPVVIDAALAARRIAAWGRAEKKPVAALRSLGSIAVGTRSHTGRPASFVVRGGSTGRAYSLDAEDMRFALNHAGGNLPSVPQNQRVRSSHFQPSVTGGRLVLTHGRGFGHGVGMCQWGAQGMAQAGYAYPRILSFYYPGARLQRVY